MSYYEQSQEQLIAQLEALRREVAELKTEKAAYDAQSQLLETLVDMARSSTQQELLTVTLKNALDVATNLTKAERGSLFLYDYRGVVSASILTRQNATAQESTALIGKVMNDGLAGWVSRNREIGLVIDTDQDHRWVTLPNQPYVVRSALAVPILRGEMLLGILTLLHSEPGHFDYEHFHLMQVTAEQMALALENVQLYTTLDKTKRALENELNTGRQIQRDFLPDQLINVPGWEFAAYFSPARQLSGDFYDTFLLPCHNVGLVIADVCDKGVGAALFMALFRSLIRIFSGQAILQGFQMMASEQPSSPDSTLDPQFKRNLICEDALKAVALTNNYIAQTSNLSMFATMFFGVLNPKTGLMSYINGGHELPIITGKEGIKARLKPTGPAVGIVPNMNFTAQHIQLEPDDIFIAYTDGVPESRSPNGTFFTQEKLLSLVEKPHSSANALLDDITTSLCDHTSGREQFDDITMLAVRWSGS